MLVPGGARLLERYRHLQRSSGRRRLGLIATPQSDTRSRSLQCRQGSKTGIRKPISRRRPIPAATGCRRLIRRRSRSKRIFSSYLTDAATTLNGFGFPGPTTFSALQPKLSEENTLPIPSRDEGCSLRGWPATGRRLGGRLCGSTHCADRPSANLRAANLRPADLRPTGPHFLFPAPHG